MPPQTNATLLEVRGAGGAGANSDGYDGPAAAVAGPVKFAGEIRIYYREKRDRERSAEGEERVITREVYVDRGRPPIDWLSGDVVTLRKDSGGDPIEAAVRLAETRDLDAVPASLQTRRLTLEK